MGFTAKVTQFSVEKAAAQWRSSSGLLRLLHQRLKVLKPAHHNPPFPHQSWIYLWRSLFYCTQIHRLQFFSSSSSFKRNSYYTFLLLKRVDFRYSFVGVKYYSICRFDGPPTKINLNPGLNQIWIHRVYGTILKIFMRQAKTWESNTYNIWLL